LRSVRWCSCGNRRPNQGDALLKRIVTPPLHEQGTKRWAAINLSPIRGRAALQSFEARTRASEKGHLILLAMGILSAAHARQIGWQGWAVYLTVGNVLVNLLPILLQRYTRARLQGVLARS
jgi:hypothetical protein